DVRDDFRGASGRSSDGVFRARPPRNEGRSYGRLALRLKNLLNPARDSNAQNSAVGSLLSTSDRALALGLAIPTTSPVVGSFISTYESIRAPLVLSSDANPFFRRWHIGTSRIGNTAAPQKW